MSKVLILTEGQTEETFVRDVLAPYLFTKGGYCIPILANTKRVKSGPNFKGGIVSYLKVKKDILRLLQDSSAALVTTMIDYYGFSTMVPFKDSVSGRSSQEKVAALENLFTQDVGSSRFKPYLQLHEFEALVFVSPGVAAATLADEGRETDVLKIKNAFDTPEDINNDPKTTPARRIENIFPAYKKNLHGPRIVKQTGLGLIRRECPHFGCWVNDLEKLGKD